MNKLTSHSELLNEFIGKKGTTERDKFEAELKAEIIASKLKEMRIRKNMTQAQLAELVGKDKTQISRIEKGRNLTISTIVQLVEALGGKINFDIQFV
ncbi:helix-turn-helix transcriptional regulator [Parabacteroides acidifaciens]|jgi:HTH-type transcriptional regulator/antitoxin HipB|uniref:Helix-turn-helix transcriptional regulator n=1 Tax=Parabacteroides acidifaciens TaxID=2290935 RepID=A0A3D8HIQ4_9BACT|nr:MULTISPECIES: helix-turn-helix transcriptional regulator [Parabacteroides]MBC8600825.1 helix-turn-helix transcriptional regulator [Parabacteroides acidifaciens]RDU50550.1 XRE family transcriptional regulator [Parabacteroides acidifaciens]RHR50799.1 XRE family transcriptional regulator [Parabacteroides sp. AF17-28]